MACCKAHKYDRWCYELDSKRYENGKEYCIFHAPKDGWTDVESFNEQVFSRINKAISEKNSCNLSGTIFPGSIRFWYANKDYRLPPICFANTIFSGTADFNHIIFSSGVDFQGSTFNGRAKFRSVKFHDEALFSKSTFWGNATFDYITFSGKADFCKSIFHCDVDFMGSSFNGKALFVESIFSGKADFIVNTFDDQLSFSGSTFSGRTTFQGSTFSGNTDFSASTFTNEVYFIMTIFTDKVFFVRNTFSRKADFRGGTFSGNVKFVGTKFEQEMDLSYLTIEDSSKMRFSDIDFSNGSVKFIATDLSNILFEYCRWPQKSTLFKLRTSDALFEEKEVDECFWQSNLKNKFFKYSKFAKEYGMVGDIYRQLKQQFKERHNEAEASKWHYREKEMFRKGKMCRRYNPLSFSNLYWFFSGYGERPIRAGVMLSFLLISCTFLMNILGLTASASDVYGVTNIQGFSSTLDLSKFWLLVQNTAQYALFVKNPYFVATTLLGEMSLLVFTRLLIPIQATLFVFSLRNKFRR